MDLSLNSELAAHYQSLSQQSRRLTEDWFARTVYCPNCESNSLESFPNNTPVADFYCAHCTHEFELKGGCRPPGKKIVDGAHSSMSARIVSNAMPSFCFLRFDHREFEVTDLFIIPGFFFTAEIIEKRHPLSINARRAGWVGCNILLERVPDAGKIFYVRDRKAEPVSKVRSEWKWTLSLRHKTANMRGWLLQILRCVESIPDQQFRLTDIYAYEGELQKIYPANKHIREKIRQQLQILREAGYIEFLGNGKYRRNHPIM